MEGNYKRQDLLKMHVYRDAIKRSQGEYVLYPGHANAAVKLKGFHEILPGLGAFGVAPDENGMAQGLESLDKFLDEVLAHLGNRTTAQERVSYHVAESYTLKEEPVQYGSLVLAERDEMSDTTRALPPSEHRPRIPILYIPASFSEVPRLYRQNRSQRPVNQTKRKTTEIMKTQEGPEESGGGRLREHRVSPR